MEALSSLDAQKAKAGVILYNECFRSGQYTEEDARVVHGTHFRRFVNQTTALNPLVILDNPIRARRFVYQWEVQFDRISAPDFQTQHIGLPYLQDVEELIEMDEFAEKSREYLQELGVQPSEEPVPEYPIPSMKENIDVIKARIGWDADAKNVPQIAELMDLPPAKVREKWLVGLRILRRPAISSIIRRLGTKNWDVVPGRKIIFPWDN